MLEKLKRTSDAAHASSALRQALSPRRSNRHTARCSKITKRRLWTLLAPRLRFPSSPLCRAKERVPLSPLIPNLIQSTDSDMSAVVVKDSVAHSKSNHRRLRHGAIWLSQQSATNLASMASRCMRSRNLKHSRIPSGLQPRRIDPQTSHHFILPTTSLFLFLTGVQPHYDHRRAGCSHFFSCARRVGAVLAYLFHTT
ncbi:hypothetical protein CPC08DRAFT_717707 [Agrocybe pediades]|nr:hypothetical protein CPC08DRAFT_717707 [Agrocybe pediades]